MTFSAEYVRDVSEKVYRAALMRDSGKDACDRMIAKDGDNSEKLRNRASQYDATTRLYLAELMVGEDALS